MKRTLTLLCLVLFTFLSHQAFAANRFWVSNVPSNWNNTANWSNVSGGAGGASVPGVADAVIFNNARVGNCTIDIPASVLSFRVNAGYTGTISQGANPFSTVNNIILSAGTFIAGTANISVGGSITFSGITFNGGSGNISVGGNLTFSGGAYTGGSGDISVAGTAGFTGGSFSGGSGGITISGNFTLNGTAFTSTTGILEFGRNSAFTTATFSNNNGTVRYNNSANSTITGISPAFNILEFNGNGFNYTINSTGNITVTGNLNFTGNQVYNLNTGTIDAKGDILVSNTATGCAGTAIININGAGDQNFTGSSAAGQGALPQLTINKVSGTLNLSNFPASSNNFTYTSGTVNAGTSTFCFTNGSAGTYTISGSLLLNNIEFIANANLTLNIPGTTTLEAGGNFTMAGTNRITLNTGDINVDGNIDLTNTAAAGGGTATINIAGAGNQTFDGTAIAISQNILPFITINKAGGTLTMKGNISVSQSWNYISGTVDAISFPSTVVFGGNNLNVTSNGMNFYNVTVSGNVITATNNLSLNNNLTITAGRLAPGVNTINIAGNWNDRGTAGFTEATSTVNFNGSALQTITSPGGENFTNLTIANTGPGIQLNNNTTIATIFNMSQGNVNLNGNAITLGLSVANNGTLNYTSGTLYGTGSFKRWFKTGVIASGSVTGLFPMGTAADYHPFFVSAPVAGPTSGGSITVAYNDATTNTYVPTYMDGASTIQVRKDLNWAVSTGNGFNGGTYNLDVQGTGFGLVGAVSDLRLTLANTVVGLPGVNGGTTSNPQISRTGLTRANLTNNFYIGSINVVSSPLPITLISFTASVVNGGVMLKWSTSAETNNDYYTIQRSNSANGWENIQQIPGSGTSGTTKYYSAIDPSPYSGTSFYRLMQTDIDGKFTFSFVVSVNLGKAVSEIMIYPNPARDYVNIIFPETGTYEISVSNSNGQGVIRTRLNSGTSALLNLSDLTSGIYFIHILHDGKNETRKILISK